MINTQAQPESLEAQLRFLEPTVRRKRTFSELVDGLQKSAPTLSNLKDKRHSKKQSTQREQNIKYCSQIPESPQENEDCAIESHSSSVVPTSQSKAAEESAQKVKKITQAQVEGKTAGRWTKEEHKKFVKAMKLYGKDWRKVEDFIGTRTGAQIRSHAQKYFIRIQKQLSSESCEILNMPEDKCLTTRGLDLFRRTIAKYEEGSPKSSDSSDEHSSLLLNSKRQKVTANVQIFNHTQGRALEQGSATPSSQITDTIPFTPQSCIIPEIKKDIAESPGCSQITQSDSPIDFLKKERLSIDLKFSELVLRKEKLMRDVYLSERTDPFDSSSSCVKGLADLLTDIQQLSQRLTILSTLCGLSEGLAYPKPLIEKILILINEVMNVQRVINDLISQNDLINKTRSLFSFGGLHPNTLSSGVMGLLNPLAPPSSAFSQLQSLTTLTNITPHSAVQQKSESLPVKLRPVQVLKHKDQ